MSASINLTESQVLASLRTFLLNTLPGGMTSPPTLEVIRGQVNRTPEPLLNNFIVMTPILRARLAQTVDISQDVVSPSGNPSGNLLSTQSTAFTVQVEFHGPASGENVQITETLFRGSYGFNSFSAFNLPFAPIYTSEPRQMPFLNGEGQIEERWDLDVTFQINPTITTQQSFASTLTVSGFIEVDTTYS